jgi:hypothetical protein
MNKVEILTLVAAVLEAVDNRDCAALRATVAQAIKEASAPAPQQQQQPQPPAQ